MRLLFLMMGALSGMSVSAESSKSVSLFNGHDLTGWYSFIQNRGKDVDPKSVFSVQDDLIRISGEEFGCLTTEKEFENYKLTVEFKWGEKTFDPRLKNARDGGVLLHSQGTDGNFQGIWMSSIECQLIEGGTGDFIVVGDGTPKFSLTTHAIAAPQNSIFTYDPNGPLVTIRGGRINWRERDPKWEDVIGFRGGKDVEKPVGEWNILECIAYREQVIIVLNGVEVNRATQVTPTKGRIQLQSEGAEIFFRRIELTPLR